MTAMRRGVMEHMRRSVDTAAHVTSAIEVDMARVVALRAKLKPELAAQKVNLTYLAFIARATVDTLLDYPWVNGELRGQSIVTRPYVNLGIAVALDEGKGLIVPVIRNAQDLNLHGHRARDPGHRGARAHEEAPARRRPGRHVHDHEPRQLRDVPRDADHQPAAVRDPRHVRAREAPVGHPGRPGLGRHRDPPGDEPHAHVRPPARRRRVRGHVPPRPPRPARELGRGRVLSMSRFRAAASAEASASRSRSRSSRRLALPLRVLQAASRAATERSAAARRTEAIRVLEGEELLALVHARGGLGEDVLLDVRVEPLRRRLAGVGDVERAPQRRSASTTTASPRRTRSSARSPRGRSSPTTACRGTRSARPEMTQRIVPMIAYEDAAAAIDWLSDAFGFTERVAQRYIDGRTESSGTPSSSSGARSSCSPTPNRDYREPEHAIGRTIRGRRPCVEAARRDSTNSPVRSHRRAGIGSALRVEDLEGTAGCSAAP